MFEAYKEMKQNKRWTEEMMLRMKYEESGIDPETIEALLMHKQGLDSGYDLGFMKGVISTVGVMTVIKIIRRRV